MDLKIHFQAKIHKFLKFMFAKKATKFDKIFIIDLTLCSKCQIDGEDFRQFLWPSWKIWTLNLVKITLLPVWPIMTPLIIFLPAPCTWTWKATCSTTQCFKRSEKVSHPPWSAMTACQMSLVINFIFHWKTNQKDLDDFWQRKFTLKVQFWHFLSGKASQNISGHLSGRIANFVRSLKKVGCRRCCFWS